MSDSSISKKPLWFVVIIFATQAMLIISLLSKERVMNSYAQELELMESVYGAVATNVIYEQSSEYATRIYIDSGIIKALKESFLPIEFRSGRMVDDPLLPFWKSVSNIIDAGFISLSYALSRLFSLVYWFPMAMILFIASFTSAFQLREIKKESFQYSSPFRYGIGVKMLYLSPLIMYLMLFIPFVVHPVGFVALIALISLSVFLVISNTIKRL
tara:strand:- start:56 stop:697 length:642 start_codon:yes stop_codon:yes gene_type:complete